jgi:hypothetical protein
MLAPSYEEERNMSDETNKKFIADPVAFMKANIVVIDNAQEMGCPVSTGEHDLDLYEVKTPSFDSKNKAIGCYRLVKTPWANTRNPGGAIKSPVKAFFLGYKQGGVESKKLTTGSKLFFTAGISGCGFAAEDDAAQPMVHHIDGGKFSNMQMIQNNPGLAIVTGLNYEVPNEQTHVSVFGVKEGGEWVFYWQARYMRKNADAKTKNEHNWTYTLMFANLMKV